MNANVVKLNHLEDGTLMHCGEAVAWDDCPECGDDGTCCVAVCSACKGAWSDCGEM